MHLNLCAIQYHSIVHLNNHYMEQRFFRLNNHYMEHEIFSPQHHARVSLVYHYYAFHSSFHRARQMDRLVGRGVWGLGLGFRHATQEFTGPGKCMGSSVVGLTSRQPTACFSIFCTGLCSRRWRVASCSKLRSAIAASSARILYRRLTRQGFVALPLPHLRATRICSTA